MKRFFMRRSERRALLKIVAGLKANEHVMHDLLDQMFQEAEQKLAEMSEEERRAFLRKMGR